LPAAAIRVAVGLPIVEESIMKRIIAGVHRFMREEVPRHREMFERAAARKQHPMALFITCSDSRVLPNWITSTELGELFLLRNAGNIIPAFGAGWGGEGATIEYAVTVLGIRHIIVCGHSQCGAVAAMLENPDFADRPGLRAWLQNAEATRQIVRAKYPHLKGEELAVAAAEENVLVQLNQLGTHPHVAALLGTRELSVYGWYYDIASGRVRQYEERSGVFENLNGEARPASTHPRRASSVVDGWDSEARLVPDLA
jgi:carbonic anhydrase